MREEIIFLYNNKHRCHAEIVKELSVEKNYKTYVGTIDGYEIYKTCGILFRPDYDNFNFEAIRVKKNDVRGF